MRELLAELVHERVVELAVTSATLAVRWGLSIAIR